MQNGELRFDLLLFSFRILTSAFMIRLSMPRYLRNLIIALIVIAVLYGLDFVFQGRMISPYFSSHPDAVGHRDHAGRIPKSDQRIHRTVLNRTRGFHGGGRLFVGLFLGELRSKSRRNTRWRDVGLGRGAVSWQL